MKNLVAMPQKKDNLNNSEKPKSAYFLSLELENVRCFSNRQKIDFSDSDGKPRRWTIILGDNGTGKTTLLQSLVAMIPIPDSKSSSSPNYTNSSFSYKWNFIRKEVKKGNFQAFFSTNRFQDKEVVHESLAYECEVNSPEDISFGEFGEFPMQSFNSSFLHREVQVNCLAYGASRKAGDTSLSNKKDDSDYITLFDETSLLVNPEEFLLWLDYSTVRQHLLGKETKDFSLVKELLIKVLPDIDDIRLELEKGFLRNPRRLVEFHTPYGWVEAKDLSVGYRTSMAWMVDFTYRMFDRYPESENPLAEPAVVLIDEIDLHLHPKWQRELIDYLTNLFPNTQFIVTTHSPLIVQAAARDANIVVCRREGDHVVIDQSVEAVSGWRADQILTSDLFDLPSTRDTHIEKMEKQRREILSKARLTRADEVKLKTISVELDALPVNEETEDDKAMDIIRRAAEHFKTEKG